jgi:hypothetical protein
MSLVADAQPKVEEHARTAAARSSRSRSRRPRLRALLLVNLFVWSVTFLCLEAGLRLLSTSRYWVHTSRLLVGSGQTQAGKKWWPNTTYRVDSSEFDLEFRTDARGYRARADALPVPPAYRVAFVGDSFTEAMQVANQATFCARIERLLNQKNAAVPVVCENYGVSATDLFEYWHRIIHDVLAVNPPDALVLCIYPGNDFQCVFPDDGFDDAGRPRREYFHDPGWGKHVVAWINLHSKVGAFLQRVIFSIGSQREPWLAQGPKHWWTDPSVALAARDAPALRRSGALLEAIDDECRRCGTQLCILVVGPVVNYKSSGGASPLAEILASWNIRVPLLDTAVEARSRPDWYTLLFPTDGHLNESGHAFVAELAAPFLEKTIAASMTRAMALGEASERRRPHGSPTTTSAGASSDTSPTGERGFRK